MQAVTVRPKLVIFSHLCNDVHATGAEKLLLAFLKEMRHFFECLLVVPQEGAVARAALREGIESATLPIPLCPAVQDGSPQLDRELESLRTDPVWERIIDLLQREQPSYVWVNTCAHPLPAIAAKALGIPVVWALMEMIAEDGPRRAQAAALINTYSDLIVGISETVLAPFSRKTLLSKTVVLPPFVSLREAEPESWFSHRFNVRRSNGWGEYHRVAGFVAAGLHPSKGLKEFVEAMIPLALRDPMIRMLIVGNGADEEFVHSCIELARGAGLGNRIGWVRYAEKIETIYPAMDVLVVPSLVKEGFGMTAAEGMLFGKPVVAFASGGLTELMQATGNGEFLVAPGDVPGLAAAVGGLLASDEWRFTVGGRNMQAVQQAYGLEAFQAKLAKLIQKLPDPVEQLAGLVRGMGPTVYWLENGRKRPFPSPESLLAAGFRFEDVRYILEEKLVLIPPGLPMEEPETDEAPPRRRRRRKRRRRMRAKRSAVKTRKRRARNRSRG